MGEVYWDVSTGMPPGTRKEDFYDFLSLATELQLVKNFDEIEAAELLHSAGLLDDGTYRQVLRERRRSGMSNPVTFLKYVFVKCLTISVLMNILEILGYHEITNKVRVCRLSKRLCGRPRRRDVPNRQTVMKFYRNNKRNIENCVLSTDSKLFLEEFIAKMDQRIFSPESFSRTERQFCLERKNALCVLLLQQYRKTPARTEILQNMVKRIPDDLDRNTAELIFNGKMAVTEALSGNVEAAKSRVIAARTLIESFVPCFASISALHDIQYVYRTIFDRYAGSSALQSVINEGRFALSTLTDEEDTESVLLWRQVILQQMAMTLLGFGSLFRPVDISTVDAWRVKLAESILKQMKETEMELPYRREMIYFVLKARICEHENKLLEASSYADKASDYSLSGTLLTEEQQNIARYALNLQQQISENVNCAG